MLWLVICYCCILGPFLALTMQYMTQNDSAPGPNDLRCKYCGEVFQASYQLGAHLANRSRSLSGECRGERQYHQKRHHLPQ